MKNFESRIKGFALLAIAATFAGCALVPDDATEAVYARMRTTRTIEVSGNKLDTGFFMGIRATAPITVEEMVGKAKTDPWRGLAIKTANQAAQVTLKSYYPAKVYLTEGEREIKPDGAGEITFAIGANERAVVATKFRLADFAPGFDRGKFHLVAGRGLPDWTYVKRDATERDIKLMKDASIDMHYGAISFRRHRELDMLKKAGIDAFTIERPKRKNGDSKGRDSCLTRGMWCGGSGKLAGKMRELGWSFADIDKLLGEATSDKYKHDTVKLIDFVDEPSALDFPYIGECCAHWINKCPQILPYVNLYPNYASLAEVSKKDAINQLGAKTYDEHLEVYCRNVPLDYISVDHYPIQSTPEKTLRREDKFYDNLEDLAKWCRLTGRSFWWIGQIPTSPGNKTYSLKEHDFRFQLGALMAYGCELNIWICWSSGWWHNFALDPEGNPTSTYYGIAAADKEARYLDCEYMRYRNVDTKLVNFPKRGNLRAFANDVVKGMTSTDGSKVAIGEMVARDENDCSKALFVFAANDIGGAKQVEHEIVFSTDRKVTALSSMAKGPLAITKDSDGKYRFRLKDSHYALLMFD